MDAFEHFARAVDFRDALEIFAARAESDLGRRAARALAPLADPALAQARLEETAEAARFLAAGGRIPLAGIADAAALADEACARGRPLEPEELTTIAGACRAATAIRRALAALVLASFPRLCALGAALPSLDPLETSIRMAIDGDRVRDTASERLGDIRARMEALERDLDRRIEAIVESQAIKPYLQSPKPTLRDGRYVLAVKAAHRHRVRGIVHGRSQTGETAFVEPEDTLALGNDLADLAFRERDEVTRILWELSRETFSARPALAALTAGLARVDLLVAKARAAAEYALVAPEIEDAGPLVLRDARHPLLLRQEREGKLPAGRVVPLSLRLGDAFDALIITGPNTGGKTVALKTTGLLAALAASGCPIPAAPGSRVPLYRAFFADLGDEQAIEASLSTFSGHVAEIVRILRGAGPRSLVLIDELGAGTDPEEGGALGAAVLEALLASGAHSVVTTHLGALKAFAYSRPRAENASVEFDVETLRPTYRLAIGVPGASHALTIARRLGLPEGVVARAEAIRGQRGAGETALLDVVQMLRIEAERDRDAARAALEEAAAAREAAGEERRRAEAQRRSIDAEADGALRALSDAIRAALDAGKKRAGSLPQAAQIFVRGLEDDLAAALEHTPFAERRRAFARNLVKGARAYVVSFGREGIVTRINKSRERLTVKIGGVDVETGFDDISWIETPGEGGQREPPPPEGPYLHADGRKRWI